MESVTSHKNYEEQVIQYYTIYEPSHEPQHRNYLEYESISVKLELGERVLDWGLGGSDEGWKYQEQIQARHLKYSNWQI